MTVFETIAIAFGMFSAIPMPQPERNERNMRGLLCAFPLVGLVIGLLALLLVSCCAALGLPALLRGVLLCLLPAWVTGGIHLDGYADTVDARASCAGPEKKQAILRDPHLGAFAVIRLCALFLLCAALWTALPVFRPVPVLLCFCLSRVQSGLALLTLPLAEISSLAAAFAEGTGTPVRKILLGADLLLTAGLCCCGVPGLLMAAATQLIFWDYGRVCRKEFGGLSGDLAGWFLVRAEAGMLFAMVLGEYLEVLL